MDDRIATEVCYRDAPPLKISYSVVTDVEKVRVRKGLIQRNTSFIEMLPSLKLLLEAQLPYNPSFPLVGLS